AWSRARAWRPSLSAAPPSQPRDAPWTRGCNTSQSRGTGGETPMSKKLSLGLAPLLVIAAFVMTPASALGSAEITWPSCTAPACPHVYKNGVIGQEGKLLRYISWAVSSLHNEKVGTVECHNVFAGNAVNPTGGGRAEGKVQAFFPYECNDPTCAVTMG